MCGQLDGQTTHNVWQRALGAALARCRPVLPRSITHLRCQTLTLPPFSRRCLASLGPFSSLIQDSPPPTLHCKALKDTRAAMPASSTVFHALAACALAGLCALQTHAQPSIAICGNANQFRPALTVSGFGDDDLNCSVFPTYIGGGLTAPSACGMRTNASDPTATTWRGMLWMAATACCADRVPNSICGPLETVCNRTDQVRWGVTVPQFGGGSCGSVSSSIMSEVRPPSDLYSAQPPFSFYCCLGHSLFLSLSPRFFGPNTLAVCCALGYREEKTAC